MVLKLPDEGWRKRCLLRIASEARKRSLAPLELVDALAAAERRSAGGSRRRRRGAGASKHTLESAVASLSSRAAVKLAKRHARWERRVAREERLAREWEEYPDPRRLSGWWRLVALTERNRMFAHSFRFPSYERKWIRFTRKPLSMLVRAFNEPLAVLAIDCEFISSTKSSKELASIAAVNASGETVLHRLVMPKGKVKDFKEQVTGINLQTYTHGNPVSWEQARGELVELLCAQPGTVLVGHGLSNDLEVLKLDYRPVVDTSLIFQWRGRESLLPGLQHLYERLIGKEFRKHGAHSPDEDARAALELAVKEMQEGPIGKLEAPGADKARSKLFVHDIDRSLCSNGEELFALLWGTHGRHGSLTFRDDEDDWDNGEAGKQEEQDSSNEQNHEDGKNNESAKHNPEEQEYLSDSSGAKRPKSKEVLNQKQKMKHCRWAKRRASAEAAFATAQEADKAFAELKGSYELDRFGKPQKVLRMPDGGHLRVRKLEPDSRMGIRKRSWARRVRKEQQKRMQQRLGEKRELQQGQEGKEDSVSNEQKSAKRQAKVDVKAEVEKRQ